MCSHQILALLAWVCFDCRSNVQVTRVCEHERPSKFNKNSNYPSYELQVSSERGFNSCCCVIRSQRQQTTELSSLHGTKMSVRASSIVWCLGFSWNRMLCSESVEILQSGEIKALWPAKSARKLRWRVYDFSGAWDSPLE